MTNPIIPFQIGNRGKPRANIMVVGEAPGDNEVAVGEPFRGPTGYLLEQLLKRAGIDPQACFYTNAVLGQPPTTYVSGVPKNNDISQWFCTPTQANKRGYIEYLNRYCHPSIPDHLAKLYRVIEEHKPNVIVALGGTALWALTGLTGKTAGSAPPILKWRGSQLECCAQPAIAHVELVATLHPSFLLHGQNSEWMPTVVHDLRRANRCSRYEGHIPYQPQYHIYLQAQDAIKALSETIVAMQGRAIAWDIETTGNYIDCIGWATSAHTGHCIPFWSTDGPVFDIESYLQIVEALENAFTLCPNIVGQNFLYDAQYIARNWGIRALPWWDTQVADHTFMPRTSVPPESLDYLASIYAQQYRYWKDGRADVNEGRWQYNAQDCARTYEVFEAQQKLLKHFELMPQFEDAMADIPVAFDMSLRGIRTIQSRRDETESELIDGMREILRYLEDVLGFYVNPRSAPVVKSLLYDMFKLPKQKKGRRITADKDAVAALLRREKTDALVRPVLQAINDFRSMSTLLSNKVRRELDWDHRWRCGINVCGTETLRWSTSKDDFGFGDNLQNMTVGDG